MITKWLYDVYPPVLQSWKFRDSLDMSAVGFDSWNSEIMICDKILNRERKITINPIFHDYNSIMLLQVYHAIKLSVQNGVQNGV